MLIGPGHLSYSTWSSFYYIENRSGVGPLLLATPRSLAARSLAARSFGCSFVGWSFVRLFVRLVVRSAARSFGCSLIGCSCAARVFDYSCVWLLVLFAARSFAARPSGCTFVWLLDLPAAH